MSILSEKYDKFLRLFIFILKYWNSDILSDTELSLQEAFNQKSEEHEKINPEELVADLKKMGPTYVKLGQFLSTRPDMLPKPYLKALAQLQDQIESVPFEEIEAVFEAEIGLPISGAFSSFNREPMASASIGQVHEAVLPSGRKVAVKIQRPGVEKQVFEDLEALMTLSEKAETYSKAAREFSIHSIIEELRYILLQELDYRKEAQNLAILKENLKDFEHLYVPAPIYSHSSKKVLTMEYVNGRKVTELSPIELLELPKKELVNDLIKGYLKQIIVDGMAHADPHPGNVHITVDGKLALMDLGMVAKFNDRMQEMILKLMIGLSDSDGDLVADVLLEMSIYEEKMADIKEFRKRVVRKIQENQNSKAKDLKSGRDILEINKIAAQQQIQLPAELSMLGKILLNMDQIIAILSPEHELQKTVKKYMEHLMQHRMFNQLKSGKFFQTLLESKELVEQLPYRLNKISETLAGNKFKVEVDAIDERRFILAFQKVANRITTGLVVAALILGAAMVMRIPTNWMLFGYPGFGILLFIVAAAIGLYLVYQILFKDEGEGK